MPGHVFVTRSDLTRLSCSAWLLPTDAQGRVMSHWVGATGVDPALVDDTGCLRETLPPGWGTDELRTFRLSTANGRAVWATNTARTDATAEWYAAGVRDFVRAAGGEAVAINGREVPLLGVPLVGTGAGGGIARTGEIAAAIVDAAAAAMSSVDVDVVICCFDDESHAAVQYARRDRQEPDLSPELDATATRLAESAMAAGLVVFIGAGASMGAGLPSWQGLLSSVAGESGIQESERALLGKLPVVDQARIIQSRLEEQGEELGRAVVRRLDDRLHSLSHSLLASLPVHEFVTTNYDRLFEVASAGAGAPCAALPYASPAHGERWLLKMHGCVDHPQDIVLTRSDYITYSERRAALAGIVQAMLMTRHMLFVGFSLADENFHRIAHDVRQAVSVGGSRDDRYGTALLVEEQGLLGQLWTDLDCVSTSSSATPIRTLEILLDTVLARATSTSAHLLDDRFDGLLTPAQRELRDELRDLPGRLSDDARALPEWRQLGELLERLGGKL